MERLAPIAPIVKKILDYRQIAKIQSTYVIGLQDWIILPGSKHTSTDLAWLRRQGLDVWVKAHAARGGRVLGICGGLQILGRMLLDPLGLDGSGEGLDTLIDFIVDRGMLPPRPPRSA